MDLSQSYQKTVTINAPQEKVYKLLATLSGLKEWWENPVKGSPEVGGKLRFSFRDSDDYSVMEVEAQKPSQVLWKVVEDTGYGGEWVGTQISFELEEHEPGTTKLKFIHIGLTPALSSYDGCVDGWEYFLNNIKLRSES